MYRSESPRRPFETVLIGVDLRTSVVEDERPEAGRSGVRPGCRGRLRRVVRSSIGAVPAGALGLEQVAEQREPAATPDYRTNSPFSIANAVSPAALCTSSLDIRLERCFSPCWRWG